jgi:dimethylhistidine N-methyltransferase
VRNSISIKESRNFLLIDNKPGQDRFYSEVVAGLLKPQKELPSKYFYDKTGSLLFDQICSLDEYYISRTEIAIMKSHLNEITQILGPHVSLIEYGSGSGVKTRILLDNLVDPACYMPIDISREQLINSANKISSSYHALEVLPVCADYTANFEMPSPKQKRYRPIVYFPGSTIGNFDPLPAKHFLEHVSSIFGKDGGLLIGFDLKKDPGILHRAYNDNSGVTAAFNCNLLHRINNELDGDFQVNNYKHYAFYNPEKGRVEMHLLNLKNQVVHLKKMNVPIHEGESIWTESSYKFTIDEFTTLAATAGLKSEQVWTDENEWFCLMFLVNGSI